MSLKRLLFLFLLLLVQNLFGQREHLLFDEDWRFAFGHPCDTQKDFNTGTGYFSWFAKTGYGDGAAAAGFDDRAWRKLDLPHDWAVEQGFSKEGSLSHGFKAVGRNFPEVNIGWYRKSFNVTTADFGKRISLAFDGVFRNCMVWVNGHYLGTNASGYLGFEYDISDYLNYGGGNTVAVRVDATMEEGWFYEGAGIYRHTWLNKTNKLHVQPGGCFVDTKSIDGDAVVLLHASVVNESGEPKSFEITQNIIDPSGKAVQTISKKNITLNPYKDQQVSEEVIVPVALLWNLETPWLYSLQTVINSAGAEVDSYTNHFGIRTIRFDANEGFFLNEKHIKIHGTNNHQDHAGVGVAMPDSLIVYRLQQLKAFGNNAYRCSHNPPAPELLDACDRMGILVIDENRLMGITKMHFEDVKRMIDRDRHHPSVISWSIGNEEWNIEGNEFGARIATSMQNFVKSLDTTRAITAAVSGGWRKGISNVIDVMGYNYIGQINTDEHHAAFPRQPSWGTEEGSTRASRGIYFTDNNKQLIAAYDKKPTPNFVSIEDGWKYYVTRPYLAGMFIWTGFDYRGEPTPYGWPSTGCYFGMLDQCGFPKDNFYYLRSWWTNKPTLHILPHWTWPGKESQDIDVWVYSNCDVIELFLNKKSLGKKSMLPNGHLEWKVNYIPGTLEAVGFKNGKQVLTDKVQTTGAPAAIALSPVYASISTNKQAVELVTVSVKDKNGLAVPVAGNEITFSIKGPGKIIGVGNGDPTSTEPDKYLDTISVLPITNLREKYVDDISTKAFVTNDIELSSWNKAFTEDRNAAFGEKIKVIVYRGEFDVPNGFVGKTITLFYKSIGAQQSIYINGKQIAAAVSETKGGNEYTIEASSLQRGKNTIAIVATPLIKEYDWSEVNKDPGVVTIITPASPWKRKLFSGLAQVIIQPTGEAGNIELSATSPNLSPATVTIPAR